ncbi:MAG TPA: pirin family protein [Candidatus Nitrosotalea sp.]|jgi:redox-sensitive bicupin YhaK (pirin superfamily)|nr:pirin family protein [Candidatus Nitrosotalea sp.]
MIVKRPAAERGHFDHGWLDTSHTFSFADYHDPAHMGFRSLRVINEDRVAAGQGFGAHSHRDMEIVTYVLEGALEHADSMGNRSVIVPGDVQRMSAGTGVTHSEFNGRRDAPVHFLQIWLLPDRRGIAPGYEQKAIPEKEERGALRLVASRDGRESSVTIHQDVDLYASRLEPGERVKHALADGRHAWLQVVRGRIELNGTTLGAGDGAAVSRESALEMAALEPAHFLLFDLA